MAKVVFLHNKEGHMLNKLGSFVSSWYYNLFMTMLWGLALWRGSTKGWFIMIGVSGILCVLHLLMFVNALKTE